MKAIKCDRCMRYEDIPDDREAATILYNRFTTVIGRDISIEVCSDCYDSFHDWRRNQPTKPT